MKKSQESINHPNVTQMHRELHDFIGDWNLRQQVWSEPGGDPKVFKGYCTCVPVLDGVATLMTTVVEEKNFKGVSLMTFNKRERRYELAWVDTEGDMGVLMMGGWNSRSDGEKSLRKAFGASAKEVRVWSTNLESASACLPEDVLATVAEFAGAARAESASGLMLAEAPAQTGVAMRLVENKVSDKQWVLQFFVPGPGGSDFLVQQNEFTRA